MKKSPYSLASVSPFLRALVLCAAISFGSSTRAETIYSWVYAADNGYWHHILTVYQRDSQVEFTTHLERRNYPIFLPAFVGRSAEVELAGVPSIVAIEVPILQFTHEDFKILYAGGREQASYDPTLGSGWAFAPSLDATIYVRDYPWVYEPTLGWLYCEEGPVVQVEEMSQPKALSFWLWQADTGEWLYRVNPVPPSAHHLLGGSED